MIFPAGEPSSTISPALKPALAEFAGGTRDELLGLLVAGGLDLDHLLDEMRVEVGGDVGGNRFDDVEDERLGTLGLELAEHGMQRFLRVSGFVHGQENFHAAVSSGARVRRAATIPQHGGTFKGAILAHARFGRRQIRGARKALVTRLAAGNRLEGAARRGWR